VCIGTVAKARYPISAILRGRRTKGPLGIRCRRNGTAGDFASKEGKPDGDKEPERLMERYSGNYLSGRGGVRPERVPDGLCILQRRNRAVKSKRLGWPFKVPDSEHRVAYQCCVRGRSVLQPGSPANSLSRLREIG